MPTLTIYDIILANVGDKSEYTLEDLVDVAESYCNRQSELILERADILYDALNLIAKMVREDEVENFEILNVALNALQKYN